MTIATDKTASTTAGQCPPALRGPEATPAPGCPAWCVLGPHGHLDVVHGSAYLTVPVAAGHVCGHLDEPDEAGPCEDGISATITAVVGGPAEVYVLHGGDELPPMTLGAAEELASAILGLVRAARGAGA
jgi:hypothetical protein